MAGHTWGDDWQYWDELYRAEKWIKTFYKKLTGLNMITKEKFGTIRYEYEFRWVCDMDNEGNISKNYDADFKETIRRAVKRFPDVAAEIVQYAGHILNDKYFEGWCNGIMFVKNGSCWTSTHRPRGV